MKGQNKNPKSGNVRENILNYWLSDTSCFVESKRQILYLNDEFIVLRHGSHRAGVRSIYMQYGNCQAWTALYRVSDLFRTDSHPATVGNGLCAKRGVGDLQKWEGRIGRKQLLADCRKHGAIFEEK